jgi:hypothetical protein
MIEDYQRLPELLQDQREALTNEDAHRLVLIGREIDELSQRIVNHAPSLDRLENSSKAELRTLIERAQQEISQNMQLWNKSLKQLHGARKQIQSTRRYFTSLQGPGRTGLRYSKTG